MIRITDKESCCGCGACVNICPEQCIELHSDSEGFLYPAVSIDKCINCGMCERACPFENPVKTEQKKMTYAAVNNDLSARLQSSSGGIFSLLAEKTLESNGYVFGAAFDESFNVLHICIGNKDELYRLRGSKYVQSSTLNSYKQAKELLDDGKNVLFSGTPCQISGLYGFLKNKKYENLLTVDVICHGTPSADVWKRYLEKLQKKYCSGVKSVNFRDKQKSGWKSFSLSIEFENKKTHSLDLSKDIFMKGFLSNLYLRPSCHRCKVNGDYRRADITLGDFWGIGTVNPELDDDFGTSVVLVNTDMGQKSFDGIKETILYKKTDYSLLYKFNPCISRSVSAHKNRSDFFKKLSVNNSDVERLILSALKKSKLTILKNKLKSFISN